MQHIPCVLCSSSEYKVIYPSTLEQDGLPDAETFRCTSSDYGRHAQIVRCTKCGHLYSNPRWTNDELIAAYSSVEDKTYVKEEEGRRLTFERRLVEMEHITDKAQGRSLLDVGAYTGMFVEIARNAGWDASGVELSRWCVERAREKGLAVTQGDLDAEEIKRKTFDVITLWDVIEHMDNPPAEIRKAKELLNHGGFLVVHTMDRTSLFARLMGSKWPWLLGMHLHFFSKKNLCNLLERENLKVVKAGASGRCLRLGYFSSSLASLLPFPGKLLKKIVSLCKLNLVPIRLNFGDLITVYGVKVAESMNS